MTRADGWDDRELERAGALAALVRARVGADSQLWAVRAPGRVNLIGEHTDYSGLPVLPIAIDRSTIVVAAPHPRIEIDQIELSNADPAWPARRFAIARSIAPFPAGDWGNYVKAAIQGVIDHFATRDTDLARLRGGVMYVEGRVPPAAGLSSSSALTVSAALAFMALNGLELPSIEAAQLIASSERYVGTMGGAMDQAVSILGRRDHALFIEFDPIRVRAVMMPSHAALVVADSREVADKSGQVRAEYNRRVIECALAARILARALELDGVKIIGDVVRRLKSWDPAELIATLAANAPASLGGLDSASRILGVGEQALRAELLGGGPSRMTLDSTRPLEILRRARHVLSETKRVERAAAALEAGKLDEVGALMNQSHRSLAEDFEVSTPRLDAMVECARRAGALGARLTGAGFGGSIIALCAAPEASGVIAALDRDYYAPLNPSAHDREASRAVLHAGPGASTIEIAAA
ncbi:MAG: galactokinase [Candidatus Binatales bacterium]